MILVVGATGLLGTEICKRLRSRESPTRALVRLDAPGEAAIRRLGIDVVHGDLKNRQSIGAACRGCSTVITTANSMSSRNRADSFESVDRDGTLNLLNEAERA